MSVETPSSPSPSFSASSIPSTSSSPSPDSDIATFDQKEWDALQTLQPILNDILQLVPGIAIREDLNRFSRLIIAVSLVSICIAAFYYGLPWFLLPIGWFVYGTALFAIFAVAASCSDDSFTNSKLFNQIVGTIALLPLLTPFEGLRLRRRASEMKEEEGEGERGTEGLENAPLCNGSAARGNGNHSRSVSPSTTPSRNKQFTSVIDGMVVRLGQLSYGWYLTSFLDWIHSTISFTKDRWRSILLNHILLITFAAVFFPVMIYNLGVWGLVKFWMIPWLVFHLWCSTSIRIRLSMNFELNFIKERTEQYRKFLKAIEGYVPESARSRAVGELSSLYESLKRIPKPYADTWHSRWLSVLEWAFGSDVFSPPPAQVCSIIDGMGKTAAAVAAASSSSSSSSSSSPVMMPLTPEVFTEEHASDVFIPPPKGSAAAIAALAKSDAAAVAAATEERAKQRPWYDKVNWVTTIWLIVTPSITIYGLLTHELQWKTFVLAFIWYQIGGVGITAGYHRLFSHRSYECNTVPKIILTLMGTSSFEGSVFDWCSDHRAHHRYTDTDKDPYNVNKGFFWAHMGWMLFKADTRPHYVYSDISDLTKIWWLRLQHDYFAIVALITGIIMPTAIAGLFWGDWIGGFCFAAVGSRVFLQQCTFFINSLAHFWGDATYSDQRSPRDSYFVSLLTFGEGYHCFHHEFPYDYRNGIHHLHYDPGKWVIAALEALGLAHNLKRFPKDVINKGKLQMKQKRLNEEKRNLAWGPSIADLPSITRAEVSARVAEGAKIVIIDSIAHDVTDFIQTHPGGPNLIKPYLGKDASLAFNGGSYNHSLAARNILKTLRFAKLSSDDQAEMPLIDEPQGEPYKKKTN